MKEGILYIKHLPYGFDEKGLLGFFTQFGEISKIKLVRSKKTKRSKGFAFI
jgi:nucleolar protein 15